MAIEINGMNNPHVANLATNGSAQSTAQDSGNTKQAEARSVGSDTLSLTNTAQKLGELEKSLSAQPVVDTQKVEAMRAAIENGSYDIDPNRIANKMISLEIAMSGVR